MSQIILQIALPNEHNYSDWRSYARDLAQALSDSIASTRAMFQTRLTFGDGVDPDNHSGIWLASQVTNSTPDTEDSYAHNLGVVPVGLLIVKQDKAGVIYAGSTAWTSSTLYLKCSVASMTFTAFVMSPPTETL